MENLTFKSRTQAKKETGFSYLGKVNLSGKFIKNKKVNYYTYAIYLAPASTSGFNVCKYSTPECRIGCLSSSGRAKIEEYVNRNIIKNARIKKTKLFHTNNKYFMDMLVAELIAAQNKAKRDGFGFSVRLNGTSDIDWTKVYHNGKTVFELFPDVQFYDYTKNPNMFGVTLPKNYQLTFSYSGRNLDATLKILKMGYNVAVIFENENFPEFWHGYKVINGDLTDYRPFDEKNVIVGLKYKKLANKQINIDMINSCFVVVDMLNIPFKIKVD